MGAFKSNFWSEASESLEKHCIAGKGETRVMHYWVILRKGRFDYVHYYDYFLPGLIPGWVIEMTLVSFVAEQFNLCENCELDMHCHVIEEGTGKKYCSILFHDLVKPKWKLEQLI